MAFILGTGFEHGVPRINGAAFFNVTTVGADAAVEGTYSATVQADVDVPLGSTYTELYMSLWVYGWVSRLVNIGFKYTDDVIIDMRNTDLVDPTTYDVFLNNVLLASGGISVGIHQVWQNIQLRVLVHPTTGAVQTKINGVLDIDFTGDTEPSGGATIDRLHFDQPATSNPWIIDNLAVFDDAFPGDVRYDVLVPTSDAAVAWTRSAGADNYALVDEIPPNTTDYVTGSVNGDRDIYGLGDWAGTGKTPIGVVAHNYAKFDVAAGQQIKNLIRSNGVVALSPAHTLESTYELFSHIFELNPDGNVAWTDITIDALEAGQEAVI